jgi:hypothetical protein
MTEKVFYPLAAGNRWTYRQSDGSTFTNTVTAEDPSAPGRFTMTNSVMGKEQHVRKEGTSYLTDSFEQDNYQVLLRDDLSSGDKWDIAFKANGIDSILSMRVVETGATVEVEGRKFGEVLVLEGESKMIYGGNTMSLNFFTRYSYAPGVGLVLTTSTGGVSMALESWSLGGQG